MQIADIEPQQESDGWTRNRIIFLSISGALTVALCVAVREVLLPFVLGLTFAYVLMPLVVWGERKLRLPRALSILTVYAVVLGTLGLSAWAFGPRVYQETVRVARDVPRLLHQAALQHGGQIESWVEAYRGNAPEKK